MVDAAKNNCAIRIGVNAGSLEKEFIKKFYRATPKARSSALKHIKILESLNFFNTKVLKASNVQLENVFEVIIDRTDVNYHNI